MSGDFTHIKAQGMQSNFKFRENSKVCGKNHQKRHLRMQRDLYWD